MNYLSLLDLSSVIWDKNDFQKNQSQYYHLTDSISSLFSKFTEERSHILLRDELLDEIYSNFPYETIPPDLLDFQTQALQFFRNALRKKFTKTKFNGEISIPDQIKGYYNKTTKEEMECVISMIHSDDSISYVYFTFGYLWGSTENLQTQVGSEPSKEHKTIVSDQGNDLNDFFAELKPIFEHHSKHTRTKPGDYESPLSCFDGSNTKIPQQFLNSAVKHGNLYYNYDMTHEVWVVFRNHQRNLYHGHDERDPNRIPNEVKRKLNL